MDLRTGAAFWPIKNGLIGVYPGLEHDETCDVAIVGAGITGALVAHHLSQAGCDVVVLDRHDAAAGSTAATTGLLQYETDTPLTALAASDRHRSGGPELAARPPGDLPTRRSQRQLPLRLCPPSERVPRIVQVGRAVARSRVPPPGSPRLRCGVAGPEGAEGIGSDWSGPAPLSAAAPPSSTRTVSRTRCSQWRRNAERGVYDRTNVDSIEMPAGCVKLLTNRGTTVRAQRLVVASGYEIPPQFDLDPGNLNSTWVFISEPLADLSWWPECALIWETKRPYTYLRTTADKRVMLGGEDEGWSARHENVRLLGRKTRRLNKRFSTLFPGVQLEPAYAWAGVFAATKDGLPYIGAVDRVASRLVCARLWRQWHHLQHGGGRPGCGLVAGHPQLERQSLWVQPLNIQKNAQPGRA